MSEKRLFRNAKIYTPIDQGKPSGGRDQGMLVHYDRGVLCVEGEKILWAGQEGEIPETLQTTESMEVVDCGGRCMVPGFVDPHTHICFGALREEEFSRRIEGIPYLEILKQGGGILSSVKAVADCTAEHLFRVTSENVQRALQLGTTTLEIKSGYGLDTENELKMLEVIGKVQARSAADIVATFLGAHAIPQQYHEDPDSFIELVINEMLPAVKAQNIARYCDVFCEKGVFSLAQSKSLLLAAKAMGFGLKIHADEVNDLGGAGLAAELGAVSADHLLASNRSNLEKMKRAGVVAILLPATAYSLRKPYADARKMIEMNLPVALATDCNPGSSYTESMQFVIGLAVLNMAMSPAEALTGATLNGAYGLGLEDQVGSLEAGKKADFLLLDGKSPAILAYHAGVSSVAQVYKSGKKIEL